MHSKMVANRQKLSASLESSAFTHAADVAQRTNEVLSEFLAEGETFPDLETLQVLIGRRIEQARERMLEIDRLHNDEVVKDRALRRQRDAATGKLRQTILLIRDSYDGAYGPGRCEEILGFGTRIPQDAMLLRQLAATAISHMEAPGFTLPEMELDGVNWSAEAFVRQLREPYEELVETQDQLAREDRKSNKTIKLKNEAIEEFDEVSRRGANCLRGIYILAREDLWAERVRPPARRPGSGSGTDSDSGSGEPQVEETEPASAAGENGGEPESSPNTASGPEAT